MKTVGIAQVNNRVAYRLDFADTILVAVKNKEGKLCLEEIILAESNPIRRVRQIVNLGIDTLVCGAMSSFVFRMFQYHGIEIVGGVTGDPQKVLEQYLNGALRGEKEIYSPEKK